jgi:hypothetical protein
MFTHDFNVYETLSKLDGLLESGHDDPSPMDRAEYKVLTNVLVRGAEELLGHLALHDVLAFETADSYEPIVARQVSTATTDSDGAFSDEIVTINLPSHLVPYGAIVESMKTWNVGNVEIVADLSVLARLWARYLNTESDSEEETAIFDEWAKQAERVAEQCLPAVQRLDAAGLLRITDLRTDNTYALKLARFNGVDIEISIATKPDAQRQARRPKAPAKKQSSRRKTSR